MSDDQPDTKPSSQRGGSPLGEDEASAKGEWAAKADEGVVPARLGGSDADPGDPGSQEPQPQELSSDALGRTTGSTEPATPGGIDPEGGDRADAVTDGGADPAPAGEPDLKDAAAGPRQADVESASD